MSRSTIQPILEAIPAARQDDARHYGVHPYFTRRPANVVRAYIERYSEAGDTVLDPFGGTGVTAIEAFLLGRVGIHNDLNPFANFIAKNIPDTSLGSLMPLREAVARIEANCREKLSRIESDERFAAEELKRLPLPANIRLPRNSDAEFYFDLFTPRQLAGLALLKQAIDAEPDHAVRGPLLLAWSASVAKLNKTFLSAKGRAASRGGSSIFSIYRYKIAAQFVELPIWETFHGRVENVLAAKEEVFQIRAYMKWRAGKKQVLDSARDMRVLSHDAATLDRVLEPASVDYIFTDPPYGAFISYLDLSILWNHWLGFSVSEEQRERETIVGGERSLSEEHYRRSLADSIRACFGLLRPDRWFSIVFQHWDVRYFQTILETATQCGGELKSAITQTGDVIWSMHKKKNSASVIAGEMIITFYKPRKPATNSSCISPEGDPATLLTRVLDHCLSNGKSEFTSEALFNKLVLEMWHRRALGCLTLDRREFIGELERRGWSYDGKRHLWHKGHAPSVPQSLF